MRLILKPESLRIEASPRRIFLFIERCDLIAHKITANGTANDSVMRSKSLRFILAHVIAAYANNSKFAIHLFSNACQETSAYFAACCDGLSAIWMPEPTIMQSEPALTACAGSP